MMCRMSISAESGVAEGTGWVQISRRFMPRKDSVECFLSLNTLDYLGLLYEPKVWLLNCIVVRLIYLQLSCSNRRYRTPLH